MTLSLGLVVCLDDLESGILSRSARVRLDRGGVVASHERQVALELIDEHLVALGLVDRGERVQTAKLFPRKRHHRRRRVELHRARSEGDHAVDERVVLFLQMHHVSQHVGLGVMLVEDRLGEEGAFSREMPDRRLERLGGEVELASEGVERVGLDLALALDAVKDVDNVGEVERSDRLVEGDADSLVVDFAEVDTGIDRGFVDLCRREAGGRHVDGESVKVGLVEDSESEGLERRGEHAGKRVHLACDTTETGRTVVNGVHGGHVGEERLPGHVSCTPQITEQQDSRRAHVRRRLLTTDVLLTSCAFSKQGSRKY